jgi:hypothetical protein
MSGRHLQELVPPLGYESFIRNHPAARPGKYLVLPRAAPETSPARPTEVWLRLKEAEICNGDWTKPGAAGRLRGNLIAERPALRPKTVELYGYLMRRHIAPDSAARPSPTFSPARSAAGVSNSSTRA